MDEGTGKQGISGEGPLRSIASPPFASPVAFRSTGPLAQHPAPTPTSGAYVSSPLKSAATVGPPPASSQLRSSPHAAPNHPTYYSEQQRHQQQQQQQQHSDQPRAGAGGDQYPLSYSSLTPRTPSTPPLQPSSPPPPSPPPPPSNDPLSHLLRGNMPMDRDATPPASASDIAPGRSVTTGPSYTTPPIPKGEGPARASEVAPWGAAPAAGGREGSFGQGVPSTPPMPALPPPPATYAVAGRSYQHQHQQQQQQQQHIQPAIPASTKSAALSTAPGGSSTPAASHSPNKTPPPVEQTLDQRVDDFLGSDAPPPPPPPAEPEDTALAMGNPNGWVRKLGRLARRRAWAMVVDNAGRMLAAVREGEAPNLTAEQIMTLRLRRALGMLRMGRSSDAVGVAVKALQEGEQPLLSTVSVAARLAAAGAKSLSGRVDDEELALEELTTLKLELEGVIAAPPLSTDGGTTSDNGTERHLTVTPGEATKWKRRVSSCLANVFVRRGNWRLALRLLEAMGQEYCADTASTGAASGRYTTSGALKEESASKVVAARVEILSRIARVFLQFGSLRDAEVYFVRAERAAGTQEDNPRILINRGLLLFSKSEFVAAQEIFQKAATTLEADADGRPPEEDEDEDHWCWATSCEGPGLLESALNNLSLAMVYSCDVMRGVKTLEGLIRRCPRLYMLDVVVFNLCTLYDLSFDAVASAKKKRTLQAVAQRYRLEDIDSSSFRMS